jgi:DNA primase
MFPIADPQGKIVAFGGRILTSATNLPKYINSPETVLFKKSEMVYGLHLSKQAIAEKGYVLITEGYLDTIVCHQFGFQNAVAPLGTALTVGHIKKLRRFTDKAVFVFDGDKAGIAAARRALDIAIAEGMTIKVAVLPEGEDPDTLLRTQGEVAFRQKLGGALTPVQFLMRLHKRNALDGARAVLKLIVTCPDGLMREESLRELAERANIHEATLRDEMNMLMCTANRTEPLSNFRTKPAATSLREVQRSPEEEALLAMALAFPEKRPLILGRLEVGSIEDANIRGVVEKMVALEADGYVKGLQEQLIADSTPEERSFITRLMMTYPVDAEQADRTVRDCLQGIALRDITRKIEAADDAQLCQLLAEKKRLVRGEESAG